MTKYLPYLLGGAWFLLPSAASAQSASFEIKHEGTVLALAWSPDGKRLASAGTDGQVRITEVPSGKEIIKLEVGSPVTGVTFSPEGNLVGLKSGGHDGPLSVWDLATGKKLKQLAFKDYTCSHLAFTSDGSTLAAAGPGEHMIWHHAKGGGFGSRSGKVPEGTSAAVAPNGSVVAWSNPSGLVMMFSPDVRKSRNMNLGPTVAFAFSPDATMLAASSPEKHIRLWTVGAGELRTFEGMREPANLLHFSANAKVLAAASSSDPVVRLWDVASARLRRLVSAGPGVRALVLAPDGLRLALGGEGRAKVWNVATRELGELGEPKVLSAAELKTAWEDLADSDPGRSDDAFRRLATARQHALDFLKERLRGVAVPPFDHKRAEQLVLELAHPTYAVRERAFLELGKQGELVRPALEKFLAGDHPLEGVRRAHLLLNRILDHDLTPDRLRCLEVIEILEVLNTPESVALLEEIHRDALLTQVRLAARDALGRLRPREDKGKEVK